MRKQLFATVLLASVLPSVTALNANAAPEPLPQAQQVASITGTVLDENNEPVIGANVRVKGQAGGVSTDAFGNFTIRAAKGATLEITYVGYKSESMAAAPDMKVYLQPTTEQLDQLVVIGYGTQKKANLTGAVSTVDVDRVLEGRSQTDVVKALQGAVPGLTITSGDGGVNSAATIKIRGTGTLSNSQVSNPLIVVDGVPVDDLSLVNL